MTDQPTTTDPDDPQDRPQANVAPDAAELVLEDRFSMVPEWVLDADIGDCALRLYAVLLRYGNSTGARMPARATLAARLRKKSVDTVDRALAELVRLGAVQVEHRWTGQQRLTNRYRIRTSRPGNHDPGPRPAAAQRPTGGRTDAATPEESTRPGRTNAATRTAAARGGRTSRGGVAARIGHDRESSTDTPPPPPPPPPARACRSSAELCGPAPRAGSRRPNGSDPDSGSVGHWHRRHQDLLAACGITDRKAWDDYVAQVRVARTAAGNTLSRWSSAHLRTALDLAVRGRGWPAGRVLAALLHVAADPATRSPARLAEAGPWWDEDPGPRCSVEGSDSAAVDVAALDAELEAVAGLRIGLQRTARDQLAAEQQALTRSSVLARAVELLHTQLSNQSLADAVPDRSMRVR